MSCSTPVKLIDNDKNITRITLSDSDLFNAIDYYIKNRMTTNEKGLITISSKNINNKNKPKFINHIHGLSEIYMHPISAYTIYKNDTILIYSKKDKFVNPKKYSSEFTKSMKLILVDDWTLIEQEDGALQFTNSFNHHSSPWVYSQGKIIDSTRNNTISTNRILYGDIRFSYLVYDDLDSLRIVRYKEK